MLFVFILLLLANIFFPALAVEPTEIQIKDSHGRLSFEKAPERIVILNWTLTEQVLELGVSPLAVADIQGYQQTVEQPSIPASVIDVGSRMAPDLDKISALQPDVIIIGYSQRPLTRKLANIAPVVYLNNFSTHFVNGEKTDDRFLLLAKLFNKMDYAKEKLAKRDKYISQLRTQLATRFPHGLPSATIIMAHDENQAWVLSENSLAQYTLGLLGFKPAISKPASKYGATKIKVDRFNQVEGCLLYLPNPKFDLDNAKAWRSLSIVKDGCFLPLAPVNRFRWCDVYSIFIKCNLQRIDVERTTEFS